MPGVSLTGHFKISTGKSTLLVTETSGRSKVGEQISFPVGLVKCMPSLQQFAATGFVSCGNNNQTQFGILVNYEMLFFLNDE